MNFTQDTLKNLAAQCVAAASDGSLTSAITKVAQDNSLNGEQIQRLVETSNQVAYLSDLEGQDDRTFEFDVAKYDDVMGGMLNKEASTIEKSASVVGDIADIFADGIEKVATDKEATLEKWGKGQKMMALDATTKQGRARVEHLKSASDDLLVKIAQAKDVLIRDDKLMEKAAQFSNGSTIGRLFGKDTVETRDIFPQEELWDVKSLSETLEKAASINSELQALLPKVEKAEGMLKEAVVAQMARAGLAMAKKKLGSAKTAVKAAPGKIKNSKAGKSAEKAWNAIDTVSSTQDVSKNTTRNYDAWNSLRG